MPPFETLGKDLRRIRKERDELRARVAELEAGRGLDFLKGRAHACALLSRLVYDANGEAMDQDALLGLCTDVEVEFFEPKG